MSKDVFTKNRIRKYFGKIREVAEMPNQIEIQKSSYDLFLNSGEGSEPLKGEGIRGAFESIFPIKDFNETIDWMEKASMPEVLIGLTVTMAVMVGV